MPKTAKSQFNNLIPLIGAGVLCALVGTIPHQFLGLDELVSIWRPLTGLALAMLLLGGQRYVWAVLGGVLVASILTHGMSAAALALTLGGMAGPVCGAWLLRRAASFDPSLARLQDYLRLMARGGAVGSLASALVGTTALLLLGASSADAAPGVAIRWWMGDLLGVALMAPLVLVWWGARRIWHTRNQMLESLLVIGLGFLAGQMVFLNRFIDAQHGAPRGYALILFVGWAALRLERRGVTVLLLMVALQALTSAYLGIGFFANDLETTHLLAFWGYMMVLAFAGMTLASFATGRRREARALIKKNVTMRDRALDKVQEGITVGNLQRELIYVNDAFVRMTGYSREELLGKDCGKFLQGPGTNPATAQRLSSTMNACQPFRGEILNFHKDGTPFWSDLSITPIFDEQGVLLEYFGVQRDITAQNEAVLALQRSQEQLNLALKGTNDGLWDWNTIDDTIERSPRWYQMLGYEAPGVPSNRANWSHLIHPHDLAYHNDEIASLLAGTQDRYNREYRLRHKDGHYISVLARGYVQRDDKGRVTRISGTTTNLTEHKNREAKLSLAATVFHQSREGITMTDAERNIIMVNKAFTEMTGYTEDEVLGKNPRILSSGRHSGEFYGAMWDAINTKDYWAGEIWDRRKDGTVYPEWLTISAMRNELGQITNYLSTFSDMSDTKAAETRIQWLSHFDPLTGLPNRSLLQDRTAQSINLAKRASEPMSMVLLSIDHFKSVNDTLGHQIGDELLVTMAKRLSASVRAQDTVARISGKEFILVLPDTGSEGAAHLASELLDKLARPYQLDAHELTVTASIGIASYPDSGSDFDSLFKAVEIAMHYAEANGHNSFQIYRDDMYQQMISRDHMTKALRNAAGLNQLSLVYQPLVDLQTGQISGVEALLRWHHPELGSVSPVQFIPLAEESGLIKGIGEWVLRRVCSDIRIWLDKGIKVPPVAVNVSPLQFRDADLIEQVKSCLLESQIDPALIDLEVTEGALMEDVQRSEAMLRELKDLGLKLSLDDFGTGYSSLSYLKRFPFDKVKIDQSFVRDITTSQSDNVLVKVIIAMAHGLGLKVIAEGVETEAQCEILRTHVCDEIQGYFFSRPVSAQEIEELFSEGRQLPPHLLRLRKPQRTLLLVDDEPNIVASLKRLFRRDGHVILTANSGLEGLDVLSRHKVDVIISDQRMPGLTGVEFLRAAKVNYPDTIRIVLSGYTELQSVTDAINEGAVYRFLTKPWEDDQLREHIQKAFEHKELLEENRQLDIKIRTTNQELVAANRQLGDVLQTTRHKIERDQTSLAIAREALQYMPLPVIGVDDEGLMAFVNTAAERLFSKQAPLLGAELAYALPALDLAIAGAVEGVPCELLIDRTGYLVKWNTMGANSRSRGKLVTLTQIGLNS